MGTHLFPTVTTSDRTIKADRIEALKQPPQLVVLGSSRSMRYEPSYLEKKTGLRTFNAGVNGIGGTADAWAMTNSSTRCGRTRIPTTSGWWTSSPSCRSRSRRAPPTSRAWRSSWARPPPPAARSQLAKAIWQNRSTVFSFVTAKDSLRVLLYRDKAKNSQSKYQKQILADGVLEQRLWSKKEWNRRYPKSVKRYSDLYKNAYKKLEPEARRRYFEKTLKFMNEQGATPLIVLTPINPKLAKIVEPAGLVQSRHQQVVDYIESLKGKYHFVFVDLTDTVDVRRRPQAVLRRRCT